MVVVNLHEAKTHLSRLVDRALSGEEIIIARSGKPLVRLVATEPPARRPPPGLFKDDVWLADDWDAPLPDEVVDPFYGVDDDRKPR